MTVQWLTISFTKSGSSFGPDRTQNITKSFKRGNSPLLAALRQSPRRAAHFRFARESCRPDLSRYDLLVLKAVGRGFRHGAGRSTAIGTQVSKNPVILGLILLITYGALNAQESQEVVLSLLLKPTCDRYVSGFAERTADGYESWRKLNSEVVAAAEANPGFQAALTESKAKLSEGHGISDDELDRCEYLQSMYEAFSRPAEPRMMSPEGTWSLFKEGLATANHGTIRQCVTWSAAQMMNALLESSTDGELVQFGVALGKIVSTTQHDDLIEATVILDNGKGSKVLFSRNANDEWLISSL
jgi:hypothetical protein